MFVCIRVHIQERHIGRYVPTLPPPICISESTCTIEIVEYKNDSTIYVWVDIFRAYATVKRRCLKGKSNIKRGISLKKKGKTKPMV